MKNWLLLEEGWSTIEVLDDDDILMLVLWNTTVIFTAVNKHTDYLPPNDHCWVQRRKRNEGVNGVLSLTFASILLYLVYIFYVLKDQESKREEKLLEKRRLWVNESRHNSFYYIISQYTTSIYSLLSIFLITYILFSSMLCPSHLS